MATPLTIDITTGVPGPVGPPGPPGIVPVEHGADPNFPRPDAAIVYWIGSVQPANGYDYDLLLLKGP